MSIATLAEFAYAIRMTPEAAAEHQVLLELAEGLVVDELGVLATYPTVAKTTVLGAAARAHFNPRGTKQENTGGASRSFDAAGMGVYLTDEEVEKLHRSTASAPTYEFPGTWPYPDPVERTADTVSG